MIVGILFFVFTALVLPGMPDGGETPRWAFVSVALPLMCLWRGTEMSGICSLVLGYLVIMGLVAPVPYEAAFLFWHFLIYMAAFYLFRNNLKEVVIGAGIGMAVNSVAVVAQLYGWAAIPQLAPESGLFYNRNLASEAAAMVAALAVGYRLWWLIPGLLPTLVLGSRAPVLALGVAGFFALWGRSKRAAIATLAASAAAIYLLSAFVYSLSFASMDQRFGAWRDTVSGLTLFGRGLGSFTIDFPRFQAHSDSLFFHFDNPHFDALQILFELGVVGAILIGMLLYRMAVAPRSPAWYGLMVFLVEGCFGFPLYKPVTGVLAACCAGVVLGGWAPLQRQFDGLGLLLRYGFAHRAPGFFRPFKRHFPAGALAPSGAGLLGIRPRRGRTVGSDRRGRRQRSGGGRPVVQPDPDEIAGGRHQGL